MWIICVIYVDNIIYVLFIWIILLMCCFCGSHGLCVVYMDYIVYVLFLWITLFLYFYADSSVFVLFI